MIVDTALDKTGKNPLHKFFYIVFILFIICFASVVIFMKPFSFQQTSNTFDLSKKREVEKTFSIKLNNIENVDNSSFLEENFIVGTFQSFSNNVLTYKESGTGIKRVAVKYPLNIACTNETIQLSKDKYDTNKIGFVAMIEKKENMLKLNQDDKILLRLDNTDNYLEMIVIYGCD